MKKFKRLCPDANIKERALRASFMFYSLYNRKMAVNYHINTRTMKKILMLAAFALTAGTVQAQEETMNSQRPMPIRAEARVDMGAARVEMRTGATTTRETMQERAVEKRQEVEVRKETRASSTDAGIEARKENVEGRMEKRASTTEMLVEARKEKLEDRLSNIQKNLTTTLERSLVRLTEIKTKIEARITKIEAEGGDATAARESLASAEVKLTAANSAIGAVADIEITEGDVKLSFEAFKVAASAARTAVRDFQKSLMDTIQALKPVTVN